MIRRILLYALMLAGPAVICHFWFGNVIVRKAAESSNMIQELGRLAGLLGLYAVLLQLMLV